MKKVVGIARRLQTDSVTRIKINRDFSRLLLFILLTNFSNCQTTKHIGWTCLYNGEQVELIKYEGKGVYKVRPLRDTTWIMHVNEIDLQ